VNIVFYAANKNREGLLASAFVGGVVMNGDNATIKMIADYESPENDTDVAVVIGVKGKSRQIIDDHRAVGKNIIYIDKGYFRIRNLTPDGLSRSLYYKVSLNDFQPLDYLMDLNAPSDRWDKLSKDHGLKLKPRREGGTNTIWLGPSQKYCNFHKLGDATEFSRGCIQTLMEYTNTKIIYRPKHSWKDAVPIKGTEFSRPPTKIESEFSNAYALATHGSNTSAEAILHGVPVIAFGPAITRPIATTDRREFYKASFPPDDLRLEWLHNISYCQWTILEMASGLTWENIRRLL